MGGCISAPVVKPTVDVHDELSYPEDGAKLRHDLSVKQVYKLGGTIGEGAFSKVKIATERATKQQYACKIMELPKPGDKPSNGALSRRSIMQEIDVLLELEHPHVVGLREYFVENHKVYLIMELLRGGELLDAVNAKGHYSEVEARTIFAQVIEGVRYLHSKGVVHRDLKLDNLLLVERGDITRIKIADFGIAHKGAAGVLNQMHTVCGTSQYIAPEVIRAGRKKRPDGTVVRNVYGPACDLWSCGVILYMLLGGYPPFWYDSQPEMLRAITRGQFSFSDPVWKRVSGSAKDLIRRLLVVDPAKRLTCEQVLAHAWMTGGDQQPDGALTQTLERMRSGVGLRRRRSGSAHGGRELHEVIADVSVRAAAAFLSVVPSEAELPVVPSQSELSEAHSTEVQHQRQGADGITLLTSKEPR